MSRLLLEAILLVLWIGAGVAGTLLFIRKGYKFNILKIMALYVAPGLAILHLILDLIQDENTTYPASLPGIIIGVLLIFSLIVISPALLIAAQLYPNVNAEPVVVVARREQFLKYRSYIIVGGMTLVALVLPIIALSLFGEKSAPRYDNVIGVLINGLLSGSLFALIALGYTLVYGIVELINFAHGDVFMIGSLTGFGVLSFLLNTKPGQPVSKDTPLIVILLIIVLAILISMVVCGFLNYMINKIAYKRLRNAPRLAPLISAIGVSFILQSVGLYINSSTSKGYPVLFPNKFGTNTDLVGDVFGDTKNLIQFPVTGFLVIGAAAVLLVGLRYLVNSTKTGKAMRAVAQNREAAALMGINIESTISVAFLVGGALAGAAGTIYGIYSVSGAVRYDLGFTYGLFAFTAAVLGGIGNINGAVLGGYFIGLVYSFTQSSFFNLTTKFGLTLSIWASVAVFVVLVLVMVFRPTGILGDNVQEKV